MADWLHSEDGLSLLGDHQDQILKAIDTVNTLASEAASCLQASNRSLDVWNETGPAIAALRAAFIALHRLEGTLALSLKQGGPPAPTEGDRP